MRLDDITPNPYDLTSPLPLRLIASDELDLEQFVRRYGDAFLVHQGPLDPPLVSQQRVHTTVSGCKGGHPQPRCYDKPLEVLPVRAGRRSPFPGVACVGRARHNDVVISDPSVSKLHAIFRRRDQSSWLLQDARSRNGTFVDDVPVPVETRGAPCLVTSGATIRFGSIEFAFLSAAELRTLAAWTRKGGHPAESRRSG
jgi:hypothetical protein